MKVRDRYKTYKLAFENYVKDNLGFDATNYSKPEIKNEIKLEMKEYLEQAEIEISEGEQII